MRWTWVDERSLDVDGTRFLAATLPIGADEGQLLIVKAPAVVQRYLDVVESERPRRIVELGIKEGGSTALLALAAEPDAMLAVDLSPSIPPLLAAVVADRGLGSRLTTRFGLDQSDRNGLTATVASCFPDDGIDLVVDDASHILGPTRVSFEVLFPRLRPGGLYVIEDWSSECLLAHQLERVLPDADDFADRLATVNQVFHILNSPEHDLPQAVKDSMAAAAIGARSSDAPDVPASLFETLVAAAAQVEAAALGEVSLAPSRPLSDLAVELMMISASQPDVVAEVRTDSDWLTVRRGPAALPVDGFRLDGSWRDVFSYLR